MSMQGEIISPDKARPLADPLPEGEIEVLVEKVQYENPHHTPEESEHFEIKCVYPDGSFKWHQVPVNADPAVLVSRVRAQIKGLHGHEHIGELETQLPAKVLALEGMTLVFGGHDDA